MIRYLVIEFEATEPTVTEMELDLLAQLPPDVAIERGQLLAKIDQHPRHDGIEAA
jgi:hypothetical protein